VTVWTISAQEGTGGAAVAAGLAERAGVPLVDRAALELLARDLHPDVPDLDHIEERVGGRFDAFALSLALTGGAAAAFRELQLRETLPHLAREVAAAVARSPCVVFASGAFAAMRDCTGAVHARLWAPFPWRVERYAAERVVARREAEAAVKHDDHVKRSWVHALFRLDLDDARCYTVVVDASRLSRDAIVELLAAAGSCRA